MCSSICIEAETRDEIGQLLRAMQTMSANLHRLVGQVREGTDTLGIASREIAAGNLDLSTRTEEQAASLEETASAMEELTSTVKQNADHARQANQFARSATEGDAALRWWRAKCATWRSAVPPRPRRSRT